MILINKHNKLSSLIAPMSIIVLALPSSGFVLSVQFDQYFCYSLPGNIITKLASGKNNRYSS